MFNDDQSARGVRPRWAIAALALLSLTALSIAAWILADFAAELEVLKQISNHLPASHLPEATELAAELRFQSRLSLALILITIASSIAMTLLVRAYLNSENSLREARVLATDILGSIDQGIITTDQNAKILSINPCGELLLEQSTSDAGLVFPPAHQPLAEICREALQSHSSVRDRDYVVDYAGHARTLRAGSSLLRDHKQRLIGTVVHVRDVTEKVLIEQRLRRMERYMSLGSLASGLQHEIKNPLSALALHVQLLRESLEEDSRSAEARATLDVLQNETRRITNVLEGFRDFASVDKLTRCDADLVELVHRAVGLVLPQAKGQGVTIETATPGGRPLTVNLDTVRIEQVLLNLMLNALAAMPKGGEMFVGARADGGSVVIEVADNGPGIPEDLADKVFDPYFTTRSTGTGMGLAICEKIVNQHDGVIDFETSPAGTRFTIALPTVDTPTVESQTTSASNDAAIG
ncbi:Sensor protein ZraS [Posidoniimonas polymericola]|uniref:histidine kinase n=1 Tax=Posidoniimonas polymericola TaxID=2528002 RepID=A0A5C5YTE3_9BACT|nr:ATP-binding protein [Posidoniimonas polymericola]TWT78235.1 Sensor protein ZraS [Posidoniimonas polymericola]